MLFRSEQGLQSRSSTSADGAGFVAAVERLLDDTELRRDMGRAGRAYAEREFDIERLGARFEAIIATTWQAPGEAAMQPL